MNEEAIRERIRLGRSFVTKFGDETGVDEDYASDQERKLPQPPLAKAPMRETAINLPTDFEHLKIDGDFLHIVNTRRSHRVYTQEPMPLLQLSYLLWCSQESSRFGERLTLRCEPSRAAAQGTPLSAIWRCKTSKAWRMACTTFFR